MDEDAPWECLACTYVNMPGDPACEMCGTPHDAPQIATELPPDDPFQPVIASCNAVRAMWASDNKLDYKNTGDAAAGCAQHAGHKEARAFMFKFAPHIGDIFSVQVRRHWQGARGGSGGEERSRPLVLLLLLLRQVVLLAAVDGQEPAQSS